MAGDKKKRRYYRKAYRRYKNVTQNYLRVKAEFYDRICFPDNVDENVLFYSKRNHGILENRSFLSFNELLVGYAYSQILSGLFTFYRITGVRVEIIPDARNQNLSIGNNEPLCWLAWRLGTSAIMTEAEAKATNQSILLDAIQRKTRYWKVYGAYNDYLSTNDGYPGGITIKSSGQYQFPAAPSWKMKVNLYFLYKYSKA